MEQQEYGPKDGSADLVSMEQLENDWGERSQHAQAMAEELQEAQRHQGVAQRYAPGRYVRMVASLFQAEHRIEKFC